MDYVCPQGLGSCHSRLCCRVAPVLARLTYSCHWCGKQTKSARELSTARIIKRASTDIYIVRHLTQNLGKNGILPSLDSLILNRVRVMRYHTPFRIRKSCGVRTCSIFPPIGKEFHYSFCSSACILQSKTPTESNYVLNKQD